MDAESCEKWLEAAETMPELAAGRNRHKVVVVGHVDHGKSTLIGRLLYETKQLPEAKLQEIERISQKQFRDVEFAYVLDALKEEQEQNITIDITQVSFKTKNKEYTIIDAPGHKEFIKNMVSGAANAQGAILLVSAPEGIRDQTKRHLTLLQVLGLKHILVVVNKMDLINYDPKKFAALEQEVTLLFSKNNLQPAEIIPISARDAVNFLSEPQKEMPWYRGWTLYDFLDSWQLIAEKRDLLRFPVQDIYRWNDKRYIVGRVESGTISPGEKIIFYPSLKETIVETVEQWNNQLISAGMGQSIGITMKDQIFVERGNIAVKEKQPLAITEEIRARIFWLGKEPLSANKHFTLVCTTQEVEAEIISIRQRIDPETLNILQENAQEILTNEVADVIIAPKKTMAVDRFEEVPQTGRFVILGRNGISGGGIILEALGLSSRTDTS